MQSLSTVRITVMITNLPNYWIQWWWQGNCTVYHIAYGQYVLRILVWKLLWRLPTQPLLNAQRWCLCDWICKNRLNCHKNWTPSVWQVCFHRRPFSDPVNPGECTTGTVEPPGGFNKNAWDAKLLPTTVLAYPVDFVTYWRHSTILAVSQWKA